MKRVLALKGGGMRSIVEPAVIRHLGIDTTTFDLITGTSGGAINAIAFALGFPPQKVIDLYSEKGKTIFDHAGHFDLVWSRHSAKGVESVLREAYGGAKMRDLPQKVMVHTWNLSWNRPTTIKSWADDGGWYCWEAARASSAAPVYFPAFQRSDIVYWDGGMATNDPTLSALAEAMSLWPREPIELTTIGTGLQEHPRSTPKFTGLLGAATHLLNAAMDGNASNVQYQARVFMCERGWTYRHYDDVLPAWVDSAMDNASGPQIAALLGFAAELATSFTSASTR